MSTRAEFFQSMYPGLSDGEVIDELIKASIYGFEHGPEVVTISAAEGIHYVPYDAAMQKKIPRIGRAPTKPAIFLLRISKSAISRSRFALWMANAS